MHDLHQHLLLVLVPLICSNVLHMFVVKQNVFSPLCIPIWTWGFGENKTWRGLLFVPIINGLVAILLTELYPFTISTPDWLGFVLGAAYVLFELPNSFIKRRAGVQPGGNPSKNKIAFSIMDKMDSAVGVSLVYFLLDYISLGMAGMLFVISFATHATVSLILVLLKIKSSF